MSGSRRRETRATVRVLLLDDAGRVLLFRDSDPGLRTDPASDPSAGVTASWWMTPGGGVDPGESELDAVVRELAEETGLDVDPAAVRGPLARRRVVHGYSDRVVDQHDTFYAVRVPAFEVDVAGHTEEEQQTLLGHRWWTPTELAEPAHAGSAPETGLPVWPALLPELLDLVARPERWPVALPDVEESSVPADPD